MTHRCRPDVTALDEVGLDVEAGDRVFLMGSSGAGKDPTVPDPAPRRARGPGPGSGLRTKRAAARASLWLHHGREALPGVLDETGHARSARMRRNLGALVRYATATMQVHAVRLADQSALVATLEERTVVLRELECEVSSAKREREAKRRPLAEPPTEREPTLDAATVAARSLDGRLVHLGHVPGLGNVVIGEHGDDDFTVYGQVGEVRAVAESDVIRGEAIATLESSGLAEEPSVYFEIWQGGEALDPRRWLEPAAVDGPRAKGSRGRT